MTTETDYQFSACDHESSEEIQLLNFMNDEINADHRFNFDNTQFCNIRTDKVTFYGRMLKDYRPFLFEIVDFLKSLVLKLQKIPTKTTNALDKSLTPKYLGLTEQ